MCKMSEVGELKLMSIQELCGQEFIIPNYQRGYRWTEQEVTDLLNDIYEFSSNNENEFYCVQPLVVKLNENAEYEVIDGQQRLTTIKILLSVLGEEKTYTISYATRQDSKEFLNEINKKQESDAKNIDFYHMWQASQIIANWFTSNKVSTEDFQNKLLNKVKFIWYELSENEDPITVFTRLNIGKIPLTDAELIKALFLKQSNFSNDVNPDAIRLIQQEIAAEWDTIEYALQNDEFWLFLHPLGWENPTRIDFIFNLMQEKNEFWLTKKGEADKHKSFRYFYDYFKSIKTSMNEEVLRNIWRGVKTYFQIFQEWYNDLELYHYVGYLIEHGKTASELVEIWKKKTKKEEFKSEIKDLIKKKLPNTPLTQEYEISGHPKTGCRPLLLLFNIQTVINQNKALSKSDNYGLGTFYKFPFHLFKKEGKKTNGKGWEIEHIASNAGDDLTKPESQKIYLASIKYAFNVSNDLKGLIDEFINPGENCKKQTDSPTFEDIRQEVAKELKDDSIPEDKKNYIWNFALLDSTTNEEYQNAPFPVKRICILAKERGQKAKLELNEKGDLSVDYLPGIAFVPPCTRNVFTKAYTNIPEALNAWTSADAEAYLRKMNEVLSTKKINKVQGAGFFEDQTEAINDFVKNGGVK